jgi:hypothetical protein
MKRYFIHQVIGTYFVFIIETNNNDIFLKAINDIKKGNFSTFGSFRSRRLSECMAFIDLDKANDIFLHIIID